MTGPLYAILPLFSEGECVVWRLYVRYIWLVTGICCSPWWDWRPLEAAAWSGARPGQASQHWHWTAGRTGPLEHNTATEHWLASLYIKRNILSFSSFSSFIYILPYKSENPQLLSLTWHNHITFSVYNVGWTSSRSFVKMFCSVSNCEQSSPWCVTCHVSWAPTFVTWLVITYLHYKSML